MPPTNTTIGTAYVIPSLPSNLTESVQNGSVASEVWFVYTAQVGDVTLGFVITGYSGANYYPTWTLYELVGGVPSQSTQQPSNFTVTVGQPYWIRIWNTVALETTDASVTLVGANDWDWDPPTEAIPFDGNAIEVTSLPAELSIEVSPWFVWPQQVWIKYTATAADAVCIGIHARFTGAAYAVLCWWEGDPRVGVHRFEWGDSPNSYYDNPIYVKTTPGTTYYFNIFSDVEDPGTLLVSLAPAPTYAVPVGSVVVPWDSLVTFTGKYAPAAIYDNATGDVLRMVTLPITEYGDTLPLPGGVSAFNGGAEDGSVMLYGPSLEAGPTVAGVADAGLPFIVGDGANTFYVGPCNQTGASPWLFKTVSDAGVVGGTTWSIPGGTGAISAIAPSHDGSILYTSCFQDDGFCHVRRWDLVADETLTDLVVFGSGHSVVTDCLRVLADGTILVGVRYATPNPDRYMVYRYSALGVLLNTYLTPGTERLNRIALAIDDPVSFWMWNWYPDVSWNQTFQRLAISDGSVIEQFEVPIFGIYASNLAAAVWGGDSELMFGAAKSCPMVVLREGVAGVGSPSPSASPSRSPSVSASVSPSASASPSPEPPRRIRRMRQSPHLSDEQVSLFFAQFQLDVEAGGPRDGID